MDQSTASDALAACFSARRTRSQGRISTLEGHRDRVSAEAFSPDGKSVASASRDKITRVWHVKKRSLFQSLHVGEGIDRLSLSTPTLLQSNLGFHKIIQVATLAAMPSSQTSSSICVSDDWVVWKSRKIFWLPPHHRLSCSAVSRGTIVLGHSSGKTTFLRFNAANLEQLETCWA